MQCDANATSIKGKPGIELLRDPELNKSTPRFLRHHEPKGIIRSTSEVAFANTADGG